jgi:hypothetical protein
MSQQKAMQLADESSASRLVGTAAGASQPGKSGDDAPSTAAPANVMAKITMTSPIRRGLSTSFGSRIKTGSGRLLLHDRGAAAAQHPLSAAVALWTARIAGAALQPQAPWSASSMTAERSAFPLPPSIVKPAPATRSIAEPVADPELFFFFFFFNPDAGFAAS